MAFRCEKCLRVGYCSEGCRAAHWKASHRLNCEAQDSDAGGFALLARLCSKPGSTAVVSPASLLSALGVLSLAEDLAEDPEMARKIASLFGNDGYNLPPACAAADVVGSCTSIWFRPGDKGRDAAAFEAFVSTAHKLYDATVEASLDPARINAWVAERTKGAITNVSLSSLAAGSSVSNPPDQRPGPDLGSVSRTPPPSPHL